jgi:hypothetical protein
MAEVGPGTTSAPPPSFTWRDSSHPPPIVDRELRKSYDTMIGGNREVPFPESAEAAPNVLL